MAAEKRPSRSERTIKAKATLHISGDLYEPEGAALIEVEKRTEGFFFSWKASDSAETEIASDSRLLLFTGIADPAKPHPYLEQYIRTHIQKTQLKRKNKLKVVEWTWLQR